MPFVSATTKPTTSSAEDRMIGGMRVVLAAWALLAIWIDPTEPYRYRTLITCTLALYTIQSAVIDVWALRPLGLPRLVRDWVHWVDVGWFTVLIAFSSGSESIFFFGYFFLSSSRPSASASTPA